MTETKTQSIVLKAVKEILREFSHNLENVATSTSILMPPPPAYVKILLYYVYNSVLIDYCCTFNNKQGEDTLSKFCCEISRNFVDTSNCPIDIALVHCAGQQGRGKKYVTINVKSPVSQQ